jgi:ubiquinone/menaquinone biosynthesis C-methylase UbiE
MVGLAGPLEGRAVLDVATGAGHTAFAFARAGAHVTATDLTPQMLAAAETVAKDRGVENVTFLEARAEALPFPEDRGPPL